MNKKIILKIIVTCFIILLIYAKQSYCADEGTLRMQINGGTAWTNITISQSYKECEALNSTTSTLGTTLLQAHLTTDADWSAMAIFSVSQYGAATTNTPTTTTGNGSGIYNVGSNNTQTTGILETATSTSTMYIDGLFNEDGTVKKYIRQWTTDRVSTGFVGFNETYGWHGGLTYWGTSTAYPVSIRSGLFGVGIGLYYDPLYASGGSFSGVTFRPVIWN